LPENEPRKGSTRDYFQAFATRCSQVAGSRWAFLALKLDEIIRAKRSANNKMIDIEKLSDKELTLLAAEYERIRKECDNSKNSAA